MSVQAPIPDYAAARVAMVESQLRPEGVTDLAVLAAMGAIARETYLPEATQPLAYSDRAVALGDGRYIIPATVLGQLLTQMRPGPGQSALVVGAATGYSASVLAHMGLDVVALESSPGLASQARKLGVETVEGPLEAGWNEASPYDLILIDGAVETISAAIIDQLADRGQLGTVLIERGIARLIVGRKAGGAFGYASLGDAGTPPLPGFSRPNAFIF